MDLFNLPQPGPQGATGATGAAGPGYAATSTTSLATVASGSVAFTTQAGLAYSAGARIRATSRGTGEYMEGVVTAYSGTTLTVTMDLNSGTGTHADWDINLAGDRGATGAPGSSTVLTGNQIWVDAVNGNDGTGVRGRLDKPFLTLAAAAAVAQSGDLVQVAPGSYSPVTNIAVDGVSWNFFPGATVTYAPNNATVALFDLAGLTNVFVYGHADFIAAPTGTFTANGILFSTETNFSPGKNFVFQCHSVTGSQSVLVPDFYCLSNSNGTGMVEVETFFSGAITFDAEGYGICRIGSMLNAGKNLDSFLFCRSEISHINMTDNGGGGAVYLQVAQSCTVKNVTSGRFKLDHGGLYVSNPQANHCIVVCIGGGNLELSGHFISAVTSGAFKSAVEVAGGTNIRITGLLDTGDVSGAYPLLVSAGSPAIILTGCYLNQLDSGTALSLACSNGATPNVTLVGSGANKPFDSAATITVPAYGT